MGLKMLNKTIKVLFDWGGTIRNDSLLLQYFSDNSLNTNEVQFNGPESWDNIRSIGSENFFAKNQEKIFDISEIYCDTTRVVNEFYGTDGTLSQYENFIVYDGQPDSDITHDRLQFLLANQVLKTGFKTNGIYINSDKIELAKRLNIDYVVDDDPRVILALASANIKSILISRLWNRAFSKDNAKFYIPRKKKSILKNIYIAEDFDHVQRIIKKHTEK